MSMNYDPNLATAYPNAAPPRRGWWSRNWRWFVPTVLLAGVVFCCGCPGIIAYVVVGQLRSGPYKLALEKVQKDPQVIAQLGEPIEEASFIPVTKIAIVNGRGRATLNFDVRGPKGSATVSAQATAINSEWGLSELIVRFSDGKQVRLDTGGASGAEEDAPPFRP